MSLKKIEQVKTGKWFKIWDLLVYGLLAGVIVALFITFALVGKGSKPNGITVSYKGERVFVYNFDKGEYDVLKADYIDVKEDGEDKLLLTFYTQGKSGYNDVEINKKDKSVKVTASNCSTHKDCVHTPALSGTRSVPILCTPHALSIAPLTYYDDGTIKT